MRKKFPKTSKTPTPPTNPIPQIAQSEPLKIESNPPLQTINDESVLDHKNNFLFILGGIFAGLIIALTVAFSLIFFKNPPLNEKNVVEVKIEPTKSNALAQKPTFNKSDWSFEVLNGSGVSGAATKAAQMLTDSGFKVVKTGNANSSNYLTTSIYLIKEKFSEKDLLLTSLKDIFPTASYSGELTDSTAEARIILGK